MQHIGSVPYFANSTGCVFRREFDSRRVFSRFVAFMTASSYLADSRRHAADVDGRSGLCSTNRQSLVVPTTGRSTLPLGNVVDSTIFPSRPHSPHV